MDLNKISQITKQIYLSGIIPLSLSCPQNIKFILSCIDNPYAQLVHKKILMANPDVTVMYLPYDDVLNQNLWQSKKVNIMTHCQKDVPSLLKMYQGRPMIEVGYHFMN